MGLRGHFKLNSLNPQQHFSSAQGKPTWLDGAYTQGSPQHYLLPPFQICKIQRCFLSEKRCGCLGKAYLDSESGGNGVDSQVMHTEPGSGWQGRHFDSSQLLEGLGSENQCFGFPLCSALTTECFLICICR